MIKINDIVKRLDGGKEEEIIAPCGIDIIIDRTHYNIRETEQGILITKVSFNKSEAIAISPVSSNRIVLL